jgi:hypothetical protein
MRVPMTRIRRRFRVLALSLALAATAVMSPAALAQTATMDIVVTDAGAARAGSSCTAA